MVQSLSDRRAGGSYDRSPQPYRAWNRIPDDVRARIVTLALDESGSSRPRTGRALYRCRALLRVGSLGLSPAQGPRSDHQPCIHRDEGRHRPRLLSDNGPSYVSAELAAWLDKQDMPHIRGAPDHPMTQGKIERWHLQHQTRIPAGEQAAKSTPTAPEATTTKLTFSSKCSGTVKPSCWKEKGSNAKPSNTDACFTKLMQPKIKLDAPDFPPRSGYLLSQNL